MNDFINESVRRILKRAKTLLWILVLLPVLAGASSYFFTSDDTVEYTATAKIMLGNFENERYTDVNTMKTLIPSKYFLDLLNSNYNLGLDIEEVRRSLRVEGTTPDRVITLSLSGDNQEYVEETLRKIKNGVVEETNRRFNEKLNLMNQRIKELENIDSEYEAVIRQDILYDLRMDSINIRNSIVFSDVQSSPSVPVSPLQRGIIGFVFGAMISLFILLVPEVFRKY